MISRTGALAIVTGGTDGIGRAIAIGLARAGCSLIVVGRDHERGVRAQQAIREEAPGVDVQFLGADLSEMREVNRLSDEITRLGRPICYLVHSAGILRGTRVLTAGGIESNFATNYLSRFALTSRLLPLLQAGGEPGRAARILVVSGAAQSGRIHFEDVNLTGRFTTLGAVAQFCRANDVFTLELARRLAGGPGRKSVTVTCLKLGVVRTNIRRGFPLWMRVLVPLVMDPLLAQSPSEAAASALELLLDGRHEGLSGGLYLKIRKFRQWAPPWRVTDERTGKRLWHLSERLMNGYAPTIAQEDDMTTSRRLIRWFPRLILLLPAALFAMIATRNLAHPAREAAVSGIALNTPLASTIARIGFGAFPLAFALITLGCLVSARRVFTGLSFVAVVLGVVLAVRVTGMRLDGTTRESLHLVIAEVVLLALITLGIVLERARQRSETQRHLA